MIKRNITLFSGGRGCKNLLNSIIEDVNKEKISLNVIVNGLDDGASTGKIRYLFRYGGSVYHHNLYLYIHSIWNQLIW